MYYVTYLSKPRTRFGISEEQMQAEYKRNYDKRVTKVVEHINPNVNKVSESIHNALSNIFFNVCDAYNKPLWFYNAEMIDFNDKYETFCIPKASGGVREITAPLPELKKAQHALLKLFTEKFKYLPHNAAHGFTAKRNPKTALQVHQANKSKWFLKVDIKDFFPSCTETLVMFALNHTFPFCVLTNTEKQMITAIATKDEALPQGSPISPLLANMIMVPFDLALTEYCKEHRLIYTRYADDIMISSRETFNPGTVITLIQSYLAMSNFKIKQEKSRYGSSAGRNWNLGLMYNEAGNITVGHQKKKLVKNMVHNFTTKPEEQTQENKHKLLGIVGYCAYIEPEYFKPYLNKVQEVSI